MREELNLPHKFTRIFTRGKGENLLPKEDILDGGESEDREGDSEEEEEVEMDDEFSKEISELEDSEEDN
ncbi:hypothetical protein L484_006863 [Morus notabilis]|uniref:Uncharacterized protein n=1 Tax=Morus notabilis TaxID=981085 RepID=W9R5W7_9ROSA|nr:hypothetical protein L484_006863 [Morus notabilis]